MSETYCLVRVCHVRGRRYRVRLAYVSAEHSVNVLSRFVRPIGKRYTFAECIPRFPHTHHYERERVEQRSAGERPASVSW